MEAVWDFAVNKFRLWQALGQYLELNAPSEDSNSLINYLIACLKAARKISLKEREARFGAYLAENPLHLATGVASVLNQAFPEDVKIEPIWVEYDFGHWSPPSNLLRKSKPDTNINKAELYGFKTTFNIMHGCKSGHLFFLIKEGNKIRLACFSAFIMKQTVEDEISNPSFTPSLTLIDTNSINLLQNDLTPKNCLDEDIYKNIKRKLGFNTEENMIFSNFRERYNSKELKDIAPDLSHGDNEKEEMIHQIQMNLASHSTLAGLAALSASQCKFHLWHRMPGYLKRSSALEYQISRCVLKWKNKKFSIKES